jgi:hypothetical protein
VKRTIARARTGDIERLCAGVPPRHGQIKARMKAHITELSAGCLDAVLGAVAAAHRPSRCGRREVAKSAASRHGPSRRG